MKYLLPILIVLFISCSPKEDNNKEQSEYYELEKGTTIYPPLSAIEGKENKGSGERVLIHKDSLGNMIEEFSDSLLNPFSFHFENILMYSLDDERFMHDHEKYCKRKRSVKSCMICDLEPFSSTQDLNFILRLDESIGFRVTELKMKDLNLLFGILNNQKSKNSSAQNENSPLFKNFITFNKENKPIALLKISFEGHEYRIQGANVSSTLKKDVTNIDYKALKLLLSSYE